MTRILHISSTYPPAVVGGAEKVVAQLAEAQARSGHTVGVAHLVAADPRPAERAGVLTLPIANPNLLWIEEVQHRPRPLRTANKLHQMVNRRAADAVAHAIRTFAPDIVHTHSMVELPPQTWTRARAEGVRVVHTLHDYDLLCSRATLFRDGRSCTARHASCRILGGWKRRFAGAIDAVAAVSRPVLDEHLAHGLFADLPDRQRHVIWNARPPAIDTPPRPPRHGPLRFGFLGRLVPEKGLDVLIDACARLPRGGWELRVAGRSPDGMARWRARAGGLPIAFVGFADPTRFLRGIDVLVVPSIWREPFGLTIVEAYGAGVPVIGAEIGAIGSLVDRDWLVPPGDAAALAERMAGAMAAGRGALPGADAFAPVLDATSEARMLAAYDALYAALPPARRAA